MVTFYGSNPVLYLQAISMNSPCVLEYSPLVASFNAPLVAFLDLNALCEDFVVLLCECEATDEGILASDPTLSLYGIDARMSSLNESLRCVQM